MDPEVTLRDLLTALDTKDIDVAYHLSEYLRDWVKSGGFIPSMTNEQFAKLLKHLSSLLFDRIS